MVTIKRPKHFACENQMGERKEINKQNSHKRVEWGALPNPPLRLISARSGGEEKRAKLPPTPLLKRPMQPSP